MLNLPIYMAADEQSSGFGAFNINLKSFIFQLITFVLVLVVFKKWVLPPLMKTLEDRRKAVEDSLANAKQTEEALSKAEEKSAQIMKAAREQADRSLAEASSQARDIIAKAEVSAAAQAQRLLEEAKEQLGNERLKLEEQLRGELAELVVITTEKVLGQKIDKKRDSALVEKAIKELVHD
ncbi:MAG TPA: F0F1 ATP synthase subunit B [Candidatus Saccharimonadales bacterium]|nr:F0F1 ATP synthase subunit B [Candidatus Saccharimonadales bacterium]